VGDDLIERGVAKPRKLDFGDRPEPVGRHPDRRADDPRFREGRVGDAVLAERLIKPLRRPEDAAVFAHVLTENDDVVVSLQLAFQSVADGLYQRQSLRFVAHSSNASSP
jgi:hypothetical protein